MTNFHNNNGPFTVEQLAKVIGCEYIGDGKKMIANINAIENATSEELAFLDNSKYKKYLSQTNAGAVIVKKDLANELAEGVVAILSDTPHADYAKVSNFIYADSNTQSTISDKAVIHESVTLGKNVDIQAGAALCEGVILGNNVKIGANTYLAKNVTVGDNTEIKGNVSIECTHIGSNTIIYSGARIGQCGFGFAYDAKNVQFIKIPHIGSVKIGNYVEIGSNTTIDRGSLNVTEIGDMTKIDNLVQIGHNVKIGRMCQIVSQTGIAGSTTIGDGCIFGGQSGVAGHLHIADRVTLASKGGISKSVSTVGEVLGGFPAVPILQWRKSHAALMRLVKKSK
jgi:UDP-3-O-[3-hydroxymyristoyl] glucosamine N-acyltransferase